MGRAIDATGIQFKLLNRSRGPAVWSPRAQADKRRYAAWVRERARARAAISPGCSAGRADSASSGGRVVGAGVKTAIATRAARSSSRPARSSTADPHRPRAASGRTRTASRRRASWPSRFEGFGFAMGPAEDRHAAAARIGDSIDFSRVRTEERGDAPPVPFSFLTTQLDRATRSAAELLHTTDGVHDLVRAQHRRVPLYNGQIQRHRSALLPVARGQDHAFPRPGARTRSSSSPKASTSTRSTSTASR